MADKEIKRTVTAEGRQVTIVKPTVEDSRRADWEYSKTYNESLFAGIRTEAQIVKYLTDNKVWTDEDEKELSDMKMSIDEKVSLLLNDSTLSAVDKYRLKQEISVARLQLMWKNSTLQQYLAHSCESKADEARLLYITQKCVRRADAETAPYWKTLVDLQNENDQEFAQAIMRETIMFLKELPSDITTMFPENQVEIDLSKVLAEEEKAMIEGPNPADAEGSASDEAQPKKRGRKKAVQNEAEVVVNTAE